MLDVATRCKFRAVCERHDAAIVRSVERSYAEAYANDRGWGLPREVRAERFRRMYERDKEAP